MTNLKEFRQSVLIDEKELNIGQIKSRQIEQLDKILRLKNLFFIECDQKTKKEIGDLIQAKLMEKDSKFDVIKKEKEFKKVWQYINQDNYADLKVLQDAMMEANSIFTEIKQKQQNNKTS